MKILYITTIGSTMNFFTYFIRELINKNYTVDIATNTKIIGKEIPECYSRWGCHVYHLSCSRRPLNRGNITAIKEIRQIVEKGKYSVVHCHTPIAAACTRIACKFLRKKGLKVYYTAHGFHFYTGAPLRNWLLYFPIEWLCSFWTDKLITINREDYERAKTRLHAKHVYYVPGVGVDIKRFTETKIDCSKKRLELGIPEDAILLISVGEINKNKNHSVVIKALGKLNNPNIHYAIAGKGDLMDYLTELAEKEGIGKQLHLLGYRSDINTIYAASDICIFPSIREGLGIAAVEGMASGLPLIVSDNRGTRGFLTEDNAITCRYDDDNAFAEAIKILSADPKLRAKMGECNRRKSNDFDCEIINKKMIEIYEES